LTTAKISDSSQPAGQRPQIGKRLLGAAGSMGDDAEDAFEEFDRSWADRQGVFEQRVVHRVLELVVMPGRDALARKVARRRGVPESVQPRIRTVLRRTRGHAHGLAVGVARGGAHTGR